MPNQRSGSFRKDREHATRPTARSYYPFVRGQLHPALKCAFILGYNIGRRLRELHRLRWHCLEFEDRCLYFEGIKFGTGEAPLTGDLESALREQKAIRDESFPNFPYVFFWFDYRFDKYGEPVQRFDAFWRQAVTALGERMKADGLEPIGLHFHGSAAQRTSKCARPASTAKPAATSWATKVPP